MDPYDVIDEAAGAFERLLSEGREGELAEWHRRSLAELVDAFRVYRYPVLDAIHHEHLRRVADELRGRAAEQGPASAELLQQVIRLLEPVDVRNM